MWVKFYIAGECWSKYIPWSFFKGSIISSRNKLISWIFIGYTFGCLVLFRVFVSLNLIFIVIFVLCLLFRGFLFSFTFGCGGHGLFGTFHKHFAERTIVARCRKVFVTYEFLVIFVPHSFGTIREKFHVGSINLERLVFLQVT